MKNYIFLFVLLLFLSCSKEGELSMDSEPIQIRNNQTDLDFLLRAIHPFQTVVLIAPDGSSSSHKFKANVKVFTNGEVRGKASIGNNRQGRKYNFTSSSSDCENRQLLVNLRGTVEYYENSKNVDTHDVTLKVRSLNGNDDSPDCVIWEVSDGTVEESLMPEGNIFIYNSSCE